MSNAGVRNLHQCDYVPIYIGCAAAEVGRLQASGLVTVCEHPSRGSSDVQVLLLNAMLAPCLVAVPQRVDPSTGMQSFTTPRLHC